MSDDLVTRLRALAEDNFEMLDNIHVPLMEAADEIERLRGSVLFWQSRFKDKQRDYEETIEQQRQYIGKW